MPSCLPHWSDWENDASCLSGLWGRCCLRSRKQVLPRETKMTNPRQPYLKRSKKVKEKAVDFVFAFCEETVWRLLSWYLSGKNMKFALYRWVKIKMTIPEQPKLLTLGHILTRISGRQGALPTRNWRLVPLEIEAKNCARDKCSHNSSSGTTCIRARVASPELSNLSKPSLRMPPSEQIMIWRSMWLLLMMVMPKQKMLLLLLKLVLGKALAQLSNSDNWATAWLKYFHCLLRA